MPAFKDITGQRFGRLIAIERTTDRGSRVIWLCQCDCGKRTNVDGTKLRNGHTGSCGCINVVNITGQRFGRLIAIECAGRDQHGTAVWRCQCDCGNERTVRGAALRNGTHRSCGCLTLAAVTFHGHARKGLLTREYHSWQSMLQRCLLPTATGYKNYGGRGIAVCDSWREFANFLADMGPRPEGHTLDRIDPNGNYEPGNCRWATRSEQRLNIRQPRERNHLGQFT